jgi:hypothetical protein
MWNIQSDYQKGKKLDLSHNAFECKSKSFIIIVLLLNISFFWKPYNIYAMKFVQGSET